MRLFFDLSLLSWRAHELTSSTVAVIVLWLSCACWYALFEWVCISSGILLWIFFTAQSTVSWHVQQNGRPSLFQRIEQRKKILLEGRSGVEFAECACIIYDMYCPKCTKYMHLFGSFKINIRRELSFMEGSQYFDQNGNTFKYRFTLILKYRVTRKNGSSILNYCGTKIPPPRSSSHKMLPCKMSPVPMSSRSMLPLKWHRQDCCYQS